MNFLAHAYLSFNQPQILVGNIISDFVKGKNKFSYSIGIQQGIHLHRQIDYFTDTHHAVKKAKEIFSPHYRLYSGAIVDVLFDHFLATDTSEFTDANLYSFTKDVYSTLEDHTTELPLNFVQVLVYMKTENWLYNYSKHDGINKSLRGMVRRAKFISDSETALKLFLNHYDDLKECYKNFFPDVKFFAKEELKRIENNL